MQKQSEQKMSENINKNNSNKLVSLLSLNDVIPEKLEEGNHFISTKQAYKITKNNSNKNMNSSNVLGFKEFLKLLREKDQLNELNQESHIVVVDD